MSTDNDAIKTKLTPKGFLGALNDKLTAFYKANGGGTGARNDVENKQLGSLGYTGTINDKRKARRLAAGSDQAFWNNLP
jgi:hypothetical protein